MKAKKIISIIMAGAMFCSLSACGNSTSSKDTSQPVADSATASVSEGVADSSEGATVVNDKNVLPYQDPANTEKSDEEVVIALTSEPSVIYDTAAGTTENESQLIENALFDNLVDFDYAENKVIPNLATDWKWTDGTHLQMTLRDDVIMGDGTPLVADDVVYTCNQIWVALNQTNDTGKHIITATADDDHTVTIEFADVAPDYVAMLSQPSFGIVTEDEINAAGGLEGVSKQPTVGSGKYKFKEWVKGQYIVLERNDDYWNKDYTGYFKTIRFKFISDTSAKEMGIESGDIDLAYEIPVSQAAVYMNKDNIKTSIYSPSSGISHLWYNMGENAGATKDEKVRAAIDKALDFDAISEVATAGYSEKVYSYFDSSCSFYSPVYTDEDRAVDIEGAKKLLDEAGYGDGLELTAVTLVKNADIFTVIQENLAKIGITLNIETPDTAEYVQTVMGSGDYDLMMAGDACAIRNPANVMTVLMKSNVNTVTFGGPKWTNDEIDSLITELIQATDNDKATKIATQLATIVKDQTICSNLYQEKAACVFAKDLKGFNTIIRGYVDVTTLYK
ncbi:MAG: ABC transporter substrate-binding protein [Bilifractor sp.]|jgi:peptide/nickel transport system substrate-binding protein